MVSMSRTAFCIVGLLLMAHAASADPTVFFKTDIGQDNTWLRPSIKVVNNDAAPMSMSPFSLEYYFYDEGLSPASLTAAVWYYSLDDTSKVQVTFEALDPPYTSSDKKANLFCRISFAAGIIPAGGAMELTVGINAVINGAWHIFAPTDDWSYTATSTYLEAGNIVLRDPNGNIVFGDEPAEDAAPRPETIAVYWLGTHTRTEMNEIALRGGDAYRDADDGRAYVYYQDDWMPMDDNLINGSDVPVADNGDLGAGNVQGALEALAARITALESENSALKTQVAQNTSAISSILDSQAEFVTESALANILAGYVTVEDLFDTLADYATKLFVEDALEGYTDDLDVRLAVVEDKTAPMTINGANLIFSGVNVNIQSGTGQTGGNPNGLGNLIIGYNEREPNTNPRRGGSHNLVVGPFHEYDSYGGAVHGYNNSVLSPFATVNGGSGNTAQGVSASINGGQGNSTVGNYSTVNGGQNNVVRGQYATIGGGRNAGLFSAYDDYSWSAMYNDQTPSVDSRNGFSISNTDPEKLTWSSIYGNVVYLSSTDQTALESQKDIIAISDQQITFDSRGTMTLSSDTGAVFDLDELDIDVSQDIDMRSASFKQEVAGAADIDVRGTLSQHGQIGLFQTSDIEISTVSNGKLSQSGRTLFSQSSDTLMTQSAAFIGINSDSFVQMSTLNGTQTF